MVGWHRATLKVVIILLLQYMLNVQDTVSKVDRREMNLKMGRVESSKIFVKIYPKVVVWCLETVWEMLKAAVYWAKKRKLQL